MATKPCPYCAEEIQENARICRHCKSVLDKNVPKITEADVQAPQKMQELRTWIEGPAEPGRSRRRLSIAFLVSTIIINGLIIWLYLSLPRETKVTAFILGGMFDLIPFCILMYDLTRIFPESAHTPQRALKGFAQAISRKNWKLAYDFLTGPERQSKDPRKTPLLADQKPERHMFNIFNGFVGYWRYLCSNAGARTKNAGVKVGPIESIAPGFAAAPLTLKIQSHSQTGAFLFGAIGYLATRQTNSFSFQKLAVEKSGRWYVVNGEANDTVDMALIQEIEHPTPPEISL